MDILWILGVIAIAVGIAGLAGLIGTGIVAEIVLIVVGLALVGAFGFGRRGRTRL